MNRSCTVLQVVCLCFICINLIAQNNHCGTDQYLEQRLRNDSKFLELFNSYEKEKVTQGQLVALNCNNDNSVVIPVAVHYHTPIDCSDKDCLIDAAEAQIAVLNETFSASNSDLDYYTSTLNGACSSAYPLSRAPVSGDGTCIQFCLASKNHPASSGFVDGEPAITIDTYSWPSAGATWEGYLNIFVSDGATAGQGSSTLGISALPGSANGDGFWVNYKNFGGPNFSCTSGAEINGSNNYNIGRTAVHEAGHYLGLYHVFQGASCADDDSNPPGPISVDDTPAQSSPHYGCPSIASCNDAPSSCSGAFDNFYSFMDYSNDECMVMFTADQSKVLNHWANDLVWKDSTSVCAPLTALVNCDGPTCDDGIQNGTETGIDCGGDTCGPCTYVCSDDMQDNGGNQNYFDNENNQWTICASGSDVVGLHFSEFDIEHSTPTGCYDQMELFDGGDTSAPSMGVFCGNTLNDAPGGGYIESTSPCITIQFVSDNSITKAGWDLSIICGPASSCTDGIQNGIETGVDCGGICDLCSSGCDDDFYDTGGSSGNYENAEESTFLYCPDQVNEMIEATFTYADIEAASGNGNNSTGCWDMLKVYDGDDDTATLIGTYCGEESGDGNVPSVTENNLFVGKVFTSTHSSGCLYFVFDSDASVNETGWEAEIACVLQSSTPVVLMDFYGLARDNDIDLKWSTASETNSKGFYIERRGENETDFESIGFVNSVEEALSINEYTFTDADLEAGKYYYRLKQIDNDGRFEYFDVISVELQSIGEKNQLSIFPNPAHTSINLAFKPASSEVLNSVKIYSKLGILVKEIRLDQKAILEQSVDLSELQKGTYILLLETSISSHIKRFSKI